MKTALLVRVENEDGGMDDVQVPLVEEEQKSEEILNDRVSIHKSRGNDSWLTPPSFLGLVRQLGQICLDPAGSDTGSFVDAERTYCLANGEDGLKLPWEGGLVFCNPPYSNVKKWHIKAGVEHERCGSEIVMLTASRTDTICFHEMKPSAVCFWKGRIKFHNPVTKEPPMDANGRPVGAVFPSMVTYYGKRYDRFCEFFAPYGKVITNWGGKK